MIRYNKELLKKLALLEKTYPQIKRRRFKSNERIIQQNEPIYSIQVIISGIAKCFISESNGKEYILEFFGDGQIIGELESFSSLPSISSIESLTQLETYVIPQNDFVEILRNDWDLSLIIMTELSKRLANTATRASYQQNYPLEYSILKLLFFFSNQPFQLTKKDLASYLGITTRSLNRALLELYSKSIIKNNTLELAIKKDEILTLLYQYERK